MWEGSGEISCFSGGMCARVVHFQQIMSGVSSGSHFLCVVERGNRRQRCLSSNYDVSKEHEIFLNL